MFSFFEGLRELGFSIEYETFAQLDELAKQVVTLNNAEQLQGMHGNISNVVIAIARRVKPKDSDRDL